MTFEDDLACLLEQARADGTPFDELRGYVEDLFRKHNREVPSPITGTVELTEPEDKFGG